MSLIHISVFSLVATLIGTSRNSRWRGWGLLTGSVLAVYWLQPATPVRHFDFWLPTIALALTIFVWVATHRKRSFDIRSEIFTALVIAALVLGVGFTRYLTIGWHLTQTRPPSTLNILIALIGFGLISFLLLRIRRESRLGLWLLAFLILGLFIIIKSDQLATWASRAARVWTGQFPELASSADVSWLGFSYLVLRLLHTLRDQTTGRLPALSLQEYVTYVIFFPALTAGPIDRADRFVRDLRAARRITAVHVVEGGTRIVFGLFKKFVLADSLAIIALNSANALQVKSSFWLWILLYAYAAQIYLDFSGYTDVAVGIGRLAGIELPENFDRPYLKPNIVAFWNSWHITMAKWFRAYFFNPLTRFFLRSKHKLLPWMVIFLAQLSTMALIGLWHGVTWNFLVWGIWHGLGLYIHNRWVAFLKARSHVLPPSLYSNRGLKAASVLLTFHFVTIGWVWFALPEIGLSMTVLGRLFGM